MDLRQRRLWDRLGRVPRWARFGAAGFLWGWLPVVLSLTVHDHGSDVDPYCLRRCYTLVHEAGVGVLALIVAPAVISLLVLALIWRHSSSQGRLIPVAAGTLTSLSCLICLVSLLTSVGIAMLPTAALTVLALSTAPI